MALASDNRSQRQSKWVQLFDPETHYPVLEALSSHLTIADLLVLCRVCKGLGGLKDAMFRRISNINIRLRDFVDDPFRFRSQLGKSEALISGSFVLNHFAPSPSGIPYLDIFVKAGENADSFVRYMRHSEEYQMDDSEVETNTQRSIYSRNKRPAIKLRVTRTSESPVQHILTSSSTTASLNFMSWNKAYSMFPRETLINHQFYPLRPLDDGFGSELNELAKQGWTTRDIIWVDLEGVRIRRLEGFRRVGGSSSLVIPLDTESVHAPPMPDSVIEHAQFEVSESDVQQRGRYRMAPTSRASRNEAPRNPLLKIRAEELSASISLRYTYTTASTQWRDELAMWLKRWAWLELYKLPPGIRPAQVTTPLMGDVSVPSSFPVPRTWDYADDQIPEWYRRWEEGQQKQSGWGSYRA